MNTKRVKLLIYFFITSLLASILIVYVQGAIKNALHHGQNESTNPWNIYSTDSKNKENANGEVVGNSRIQKETSNEKDLKPIGENNIKYGFQKIVQYLKNEKSSIGSMEIIILGVIFLLVVLIGYKRLAKKTQKKYTEINNISIKPSSNTTENETISIHEQNVTQKTSVRDPLRLELINWEQNLNTIQRRKNNETIQEWFKRINCSNDIVAIYESIRYGGRKSEVNDMEIVHDWIKKNPR